MVSRCFCADFRVVSALSALSALRLRESHLVGKVHGDALSHYDRLLSDHP